MFDCLIIDQLTFPMARRALSKNSIIPKKRKNTPNPVSPIPISVDFKKQNNNYHRHVVSSHKKLSYRHKYTKTEKNKMANSQIK